ncbi:MAG: M15 family metallopeptidase [Oscillospiraceae bacterium]|nr:M15 family metallopeptidase [Oscillospiraceae bacterium]
MKRNPRRRSAYQGYQGRRRRRANPVPILLVLVLLAGAGYLAYRHFHAPAERPADQPPASAPDGAEPAESPAEHVTTPSGIPCTRTDLGEEALYTGDLILVNNQIFYHFPDEPEKSLTVIYDNKTPSYYVRDREVLLAPHALAALNEMMDAFQAQGGSKSVNVVAGFRTREFQEHLFNQSAEQNGLEHAQQFVAQPGGSEHHTGLVVDFSILHADGSSGEYRGVGEYAWINGNCQNYGWVVRYDLNKVAMTGISTEPWHFRYVGVPHATVMVRENLCLEEYIDYLRQFPFEGEHLTAACADGTEWEIWYCEGTEAYVPDSGTFAVSGNNVDGIIVTYQVS